MLGLLQDDEAMEQWNELLAEAEEDRGHQGPFGCLGPVSDLGTWRIYLR